MRIDLSLRVLRNFAVVGEELHFGRAAARLSTTQPSVSRSVRDLERALGTPLLERTSRRVRLTDAGRQLMAALPGLLADLDGTLDSTRRVGAGEEGRLAVAFVASAANRVLPALVPRLRARLPRAELVLAESFDLAMVDGLTAGTIAVALMRSIQPRPGVVYEPLYVESSCLAVPTDHGLSRRATASYADLRGEPLITWPREQSPEPTHDIIAGCRAAGFEPRVVQEATSPATILGLVAAGQGVAVIAESYAVLRPSDVAFIPFPGRDTTVYLAWRETTRSALRDEFLHVAREVVALGAARAAPSG